MKNKSLVLSLGSVILGTILLFSCQKINEYTELGDDLIPPIDNIHTFDTTLEIQAFVDSFTMATDSTRSFREDEHFLGRITNDPFFGQTDARIFLQLQPAVQRFTFLNKSDSLLLDSVVLVMTYQETYGDTTIPQTINVYEVAQASDFTSDSAYKIRDLRVVNGPLLGSRTFRPQDLNDSVKAYQDTTISQMRIRLDDSFGQRLLNYDSTINSAYYDDSTFDSKMKGFALQSVSGGNAIMGFDLTGKDTKLAIYYRYYKGGVTNIDTTVAYFTFAGNNSSASANYIRRDYSGTPLEMAVGGTTPDNYVYIQNTPGSFATLRVPGLSTLNNRVVHRAEVIMEEIYDISDSTFRPPPAMFLEVYDSIDKVFRNVPYDLSFDFSGALNFETFGVFPFRGFDPANNPIYKWNFNVTRYVQNIVNGKEAIYPSFRLSSPLETTIMYRFNSISESLKRTISINGFPGKGRVRLGGGNHPSTQKMRLRLVYSKI